jgi:hypothetical protein
MLSGLLIKRRAAMGISKDLATGIETRIPVGQAEIRAAAAAASGFFFKGGQMGYARISEVREAERAVVFAISALNGQQLIQFRVFDTQTEPGVSRVRVGIGDHLQVQARSAFGIPADRKRVAGFGSYLKFMDAFAAELEKLRGQP